MQLKFGLDSSSSRLEPMESSEAGFLQALWRTQPEVAAACRDFDLDVTLSRFDFVGGKTQPHVGSCSYDSVMTPFELEEADDKHI